MNKAFIFDFDGVIINTEEMWESYKNGIMSKLVGVEIDKKLGSTIGISLDLMYEKVIGLGAKISKEDFNKPFFDKAQQIYKEAPLTPGLDFLIDLLIQLNFSIAIVSVSPREWLDIAINRLVFKDKIKYIISLHDRSDLRSKPAPDGYIEAMKQLNCKPENTIVLEDSNAGITSAKSSGAYVIGFKENLVKDYKQQGADIYAENMQEVVRIVNNLQT